MFERYTEKARRVIFFARYEASTHGTKEIEPELILLGIVREQPELLKALLRPDFALTSIREEVDRKFSGRVATSTKVPIPLSTPSKQVLGYAGEEADQRESMAIMPQHLLAGLLHVESQAQKMLIDAGLTVEALDQLTQMSPEEQKAFQATLQRKVRQRRWRSTAKLLLTLLYVLLLGQVMVKKESAQWASHDTTFYGFAFLLLASGLVFIGLRQYKQAELPRRQAIRQLIVLAVLLVASAGMIAAQ